MRGQHRAEIAAFWDRVVADFFAERHPHREEEDLKAWFKAYAGSGAGKVCLDAFPEPYIGPLDPKRGEPELVLLGLNPGRADLRFQGLWGEFREPIVASGFSTWAVTEPYLKGRWRDHYPRNVYHESRLLFARRWTRKPHLESPQMLVMEMFPWHSDRVTSAIKPETRLLEKYVWNPLAEFDQPVVFAFGKPWVEAARTLGLATQSVKARFHRPSRRLDVFSLPSGQRLAVVHQRGNSNPPDEEDTENLKRALALL